MNKAQLIEALAVRLDGNKKTAGDAVEGVLQTIYTEVAAGRKVQITGFGVFEKRDRAARIARNPATGATVRVKKTSVPAFRAGAEFKQITSGAKKVAKAAPAKKTAAKKSATKTAAKKVAAKKAPAKKAAAKKTAAKKATKRVAKKAR